MSALTTQYTVRRAVEGSQLRELLQDIAPQFCRRYLLVVRPSLGTSQTLHTFLSRLAPSFVSRKQASEWPGTQLLDGELADVYEGELSHHATETLAASVGSLLDFQQPSLPEDLSLLREDGSPWLITCAHEGDIYLELSEQERQELQRIAPWFARLLGSGD